MFEKFLTEQVQKVTKTYKISPKDTRQKLLFELEKLPELKNKIEQTDDLKKIYRTRDYKNFIKRVKKNIYYQLRTYQRNDGNALNELISLHVSTKERLPYLQSFFEQLNPYWENSKCIIDLGGGLFPASVPLESFKEIKDYVWLDKDPQAFGQLTAWKRRLKLKNLHLFNHNFSEIDWPHYLPENTDRFDLALMLKLIPVVFRQERDLLDTLIKVPAKIVLVTGSKEALTKKQNIEFRERRIIERFIKETGWETIAQIDIPNEFGYLLKL